MLDRPSNQSIISASARRPVRRTSRRWQGNQLVCFELISRLLVLLLGHCSVHRLANLFFFLLRRDFFGREPGVCFV